MYCASDYDGESTERDARDAREEAERREDERDEMRAREREIEMNWRDPDDEPVDLVAIANGWAATTLRAARKAA